MDGRWISGIGKGIIVYESDGTMLVYFWED